MILYCDTSALIKLYVAEQGSDRMHRLLERAEVVATVRLTWVEAHAAMARRARERARDVEALGRARSALRADWPRYFVLELTPRLAEQAAENAETFALRAHDSVQLTSAARMAEQIGQEVTFACFDHRLNRAARVLAMPTPCE